jgi:hypothetical protein
MTAPSHSVIVPCQYLGAEWVFVKGHVKNLAIEISITGFMALPNIHIEMVYPA